MIKKILCRISLLGLIMTHSITLAHAGVDITTFSAALSDHYGAWSTCRQAGLDFPFAHVDDSDYCACPPATPVFIATTNVMCVACGPDSTPSTGTPGDGKPCQCVGQTDDHRISWQRDTNSCKP